VPEYKAIIPFHKGIQQTIAQFEAEPARKVIDEADNAKMDWIINLHTRASTQE